jgi:hypothetical protein
MALIREREWGLLLMDEVHVVPAQMFRKVGGMEASHSNHVPFVRYSPVWRPVMRHWCSGNGLDS